jgi:autotransporter passenger strand-loop-strand repeat protein
VQGGDVQVISGGEVVATTVNAGMLTIEEGGYASKTTVHLNAFQLV